MGCRFVMIILSIIYIVEHCWEHLTYEIGKLAFEECNRILKPDGIMRIAMPDLDEAVKLYIQNEDAGFGSPCKLMNLTFHGWGHQYIYNFDDLKELLLLTGFKSVERKRHGISDHAKLKNTETRTNKYEWLIVEAAK